MNPFDKEPILIMAALQAAIQLGVAFGVHLTSDQTIAINGLAAAIIALVMRSLVTPNKKAAPPPS